MQVKKIIAFSVLLALAPAGQAMAASATAADSATASTQPASSDCSNGFGTRLAAAYREDAQPADPNATPTPRRAMDAPLDSPPFPSSEWQIGALPAPIGVPDTNAQYPLEKALACNALGHWMQRNRIEVFGWITPSANLSSSGFTNYPLSYNTRPNRLEFDQAVINIQRVEDTVQTDHIDWGFNISNLYGYDYHYTVMKGVFSNQLLNHPNSNGPQAGKVYGDDPMLFYGDLYIPWVAEGMVVRVGRYLSPPDIEAQFSPQNYLMTHSILYTTDPYTQMGIMTSTRLSPQWTVQLGINASNDTAPWNHSARPTLQACARWVSASNNDMLYPCVNSLNGSDYNYNNVQMYVMTWGHRFSEKVHILTEAYRIFGRNIPGFGPGGTPGVVASSPLPGEAGAFGAVNYLNIELSPRNMLSIRNEFYNDERGQRTGFATRYSSHTVGITHWVSQDLEIQPELRYEHSYDVDAYNGGKKNDQAVALIDAIIHF
ncbi:outer membrane beta-barrel protein [Rhodanobacter sp. L36]|uniref:outer membrane beta-barrel protein n=1 Tax=Rhodanobacter sp. L36 TaxID=1747221 RepID=UPI00131AE3B3|nr:outer membrane beta-barrel protein [Rhodanobacter sp. L36]